MSVEAQPGAGTAFRMEFPTAPMPVKSPQSASSSAASKLEKEPTPAKSQEATAKPKAPLARVIDI
jgi:hypothetical protein